MAAINTLHRVPGGIRVRTPRLKDMYGYPRTLDGLFADNWAGGG